jgi:hypothetical protein
MSGSKRGSKSKSVSMSTSVGVETERNRTPASQGRVFRRQYQSGHRQPDDRIRLDPILVAPLSELGQLWDFTVRSTEMWAKHTVTRGLIR